MECPNCHAENLEDSKFCSTCATPLELGEGLAFAITKTIATPLPVFAIDSLIAGKYRIIEEIGRGGMGVVYKAEDIKLKRMVALKFLPPELADFTELKERFLIEAQAAAALSHPNICVIHEVGESEGRSYIAMEYVEGDTIQGKIRKKSLTTDDSLSIMSQVAEGLEEAHRKGIVHRDIKSANIMLTSKGQAKIMDFGLAKLQEGSGLTKSHTTLGTVAYMSPEQAQSKKVDSRSDIWSLGVVLYEMLSGQLPFRGERESAVLYSVVHEEPRPLKEYKHDVPPELQQIINRALKKKPENRYSSAAEMLGDIKKYQDMLHAEELGALSFRTILRRIRKPRIAIPAICTILLIALASVWFFNRQAKIRWARQEILPQIEQLLEGNFRNYAEPYKRAEEAEKYIPNDPQLAEIFSKCSLSINVKTEPPGANIYVKEYQTPNSEWEYLGVSPLENVRLHIGVFRWKLEKEGYETVLAASTNWNVGKSESGFVPFDLVRVLDKKGSIPDRMVRVPATKTPIGNIDDFYMDRYEVTNKQYREFITNGGYSNKEFWKHDMVKDGTVLTWDEAMAEFVDQTDRPGPAMWQAGDYPDGEGDYPVSGISWYEAAAYAEFVGKSLPTVTHWGIACGEYNPMLIWFQFGGFAFFAPFSNFQAEGPVPVGSLPGFTTYGAFDMAGNVREWCWNKSQLGRVVRGGAWNDNTYMFQGLAHAYAFDRSIKNGFRCAFYPSPDRIPDTTFGLIKLKETRDYYKEKPASDSIYQVYKEQFSYDKSDLNAQVEWKDESHDEWIEEQITFDAAYEGSRMVAVLFLPKNSAPPYQTVIYFPGVQAQWRGSSREIESAREFKVFLSFVVKNGRAALYPVYLGTMERRDDDLLLSSPDSFKKTEYRIKVVKDFRRCIDYLETRPDIDSEKLAYYGMSWGAAWPGVIIPAVEERLKASILMPGGLDFPGRPEVHPFNYVTRVKTPTLMLNGKYDRNRPYETSVKPLFDFLGTPDEHKVLKLYETDHIPPRLESIKETLAWLDKYLGPVKK